MLDKHWDRFAAEERALRARSGHVLRGRHFVGAVIMETDVLLESAGV